MKDAARAIRATEHFRGSAPMEATPVIIESPYRSNDVKQLEANVELAINACRFAVASGCNPFASHLFYPLFLDDNLAHERAAGIGHGFVWGLMAREVWFVLREHEVMTDGMLQAFEFYAPRAKNLRYFRTADNGKSFWEVKSQIEKTNAILPVHRDRGEASVDRPVSQGDGSDGSGRGDSGEVDGTDLPSL